MNSLAKQNFSTLAEDGINNQIQIEQTASQVYLAAAAYFARDNVALPGLERFFREQAHENQESAQFLIDYQNTRGGLVEIKQIPEPNTEWTSAMNAIESSVSLEKDVNKASLNLTTLAIDQSDPHFYHILKQHSLKHRVQSIEELAKAITQLQRSGGDGLGLYLVDQDIWKYGHFSVGRLGLNGDH
ncbi:ferritin-like superfamily [Umbelopsis sp. PMI_123]|nr:ferritin-like superfamily [Umbelopsis sp. PMI_123]